MDSTPSFSRRLRTVGAVSGVSAVIRAVILLDSLIVTQSCSPEIQSCGTKNPSAPLFNRASTNPPPRTVGNRGSAAGEENHVDS